MTYQIFGVDPAIDQRLKGVNFALCLLVFSHLQNSIMIGIFLIGLLETLDRMCRFCRIGSDLWQVFLNIIAVIPYLNGRKGFY